MKPEQVEKIFLEGMRSARTWDELTAAFAWREFQLKHPILGPLVDVLASVGMAIIGKRIW